MSFFKKTLLFTALFLIIFGVIAYLFLKKTSPSNTTPKQTEETIQLNKQIESTVLPEAQLIDKGTYLIQEGKQEANSPNPDYSIYYFQETGQYSIVLLKTPLEETRKEAEEAFLKQVAASGVTKQDACKLFVTVQTIASVDEINSGRNFGLSFCPNAKNFD